MIKLIVFDFDGVFSNSTFYFDNNDNIKKTYNAKDAYSLKIMKKYDIKSGIITNDKVISIEHAPHIFDRLDKVSLGSGEPKIEVLDRWINDYDISYNEVAYIGDDLPDISVLEKVGFSACPNDAVDNVKNVVKYICKNKGGEGAVREFVDLIIKNNCNKLDNISNKKITIFKYPYTHIELTNIIDSDILKKITNYFDNVPEQLFCKESIPHSILTKLNLSTIKNNAEIKVECIENANEDNKQLKNIKEKNIKITNKCTGQQGINRVFIDSNNINLYPEINNLVLYLTDSNTISLLEKTFDINLKDTALRIELLRNMKGHYLTPHLDCKEKIISLLTFLNHNDESEENGTDIYIKKNDTTNIERSIIDRKFENFETVKTVKYKFNNTFIFHPSNNSWHGLNPGKDIVDRRVIHVNYVNNEYSDYTNLLKVKNYYNKITIVIPVRKGSTRCKNKNIRDFGNSNLLKLKIETLKKVKGVDRILVSSDCNKMLQIATDLGVDIHKRDEKYCTTECSGSEFMTNLAEQVLTEYFIYSTCVTPLIDSNQIEKCINNINKLNSSYDSIVLANITKQFMWDYEKPINYKLDNAPPSQELPEYYIPNFACCLSKTSSVIKNNNVIGKTPYFIKTDAISGIDIDESSDFIMAELLHNHNIQNEKICKMMLERRNNKILLLDCTIRDGGYLNNWNFSDEDVIDCYKAATEAGYDYFEIGFRTNKDSLKNKGKWCYSTEIDINNITEAYKGCKIAVMAKMGTVTINDFLKKENSNISMVRVLIPRTTTNNGIQTSLYNREDIKKAKDFCKQLISYGYEICVNFGCGDIIDKNEISIIASEFHELKIKALYLADTYGGFNHNNISSQLHKFYIEFNKYNSEIPFGFHCHNNNEDALYKTINAIYHGCTMIDSCIGGLGRGAGNLKSEQLMSYLYNNISEYINKITPLIIYFDKHILSKNAYCNNNQIQSHPYYMISSVLSLHPNYIADILMMKTDVVHDIKLIMKLDEYSKEKNERNYNKNLIKILLQ